MEFKKDPDKDSFESSGDKVDQKVRPSGVSGDRKASEFESKSRGVGAALLSKVRQLKPHRANEIVEALMGEGTGYVSGLLTSQSALLSAVETADAILSPKSSSGHVGSAGYTVVRYQRNKRSARGRGRRGGGGTRRGRGRGQSQLGMTASRRKAGRVGSGAKLSGSGAKLAGRKSLAKAARVSTSKPRKPGSATPGVSAWSRKLEVKEWGLVTDGEGSGESDSDSDGHSAPTEDPDDDAYPVDPALEKAVACPIRRRRGTIWGYIVWIRSRVASIVYGENRMLRLRLPTKGKLASLGAGAVVVITVKESQHPDGSVEVSHSFAKYPAGWAEKPSAADLPRVKAVVTSFASFEKGNSVGEAIVPLTGFTGQFRAPHHENIAIGSSFVFTPTFEGVVMVIGDLPATCVFTPSTSKSAGPPATRADLVEGFLCPEKQLQCIIKRELKVDSMPFVGKSQSVFEYSHGADLVRALQNGGKAKKIQSVHLKDIEEVLVKACVYSKDRPDSEEARLRAKIAELRGLLSTERARFEQAHGLGESKAEVIAHKGLEVSELEAKIAQEQHEGKEVPEETSMMLQCLREEEDALVELSADAIGLPKAIQAKIDSIQGELGVLEARLAGALAVVEQEVLALVHDQHKHLYVPTAQNQEAFAKWVKRDLARAAKEGERLQIVVGVFVDEECTLGSLYNSEDVPYCNKKQYPWACSFTLIGSPVTCYTLGRQGSFIPSESTRSGKRILLVELDSRYKSSGTLPKPRLKKLHQPRLRSQNGLAAELQSREHVLVSLAEDDPRFPILRDQCKASVYRKKGDLVVLACPFETLAEAEKFALKIAEKPRGMFSMLKRDLYSLNTLTLTCSGKRPVTPEELFFLTNAMGVLPIGGDRYRISTNMKLLEVAQNLHFHNEYLQKDLKKFIAIRDDKDRVVKLGTKKPPKNVREYYRLEPDLEQKQPVDAGASWYHMTNLPNGISTAMLHEALSTFEWWLSDSKETDVLLDEGPFQPEAWLKLPAGVVVPISAVIASRPVAIIQADAPYSLQRSLMKASVAPQPVSNPLDVLDLGERELGWKPTSKMKSVVEKKVSGRARALTRAVPKKISKILRRPLVQGKVPSAPAGPQVEGSLAQASAASAGGPSVSAGVATEGGGQGGVGDQAGLAGGGPSDSKLGPEYSSPSSDAEVEDPGVMYVEDDSETDTSLSSVARDRSARKPEPEIAKGSARPVAGKKRGIHQSTIEITEPVEYRTSTGPEVAHGFFPQEEASKRSKQGPLNSFIAALNNFTQ